jgi:hypothetical protein
MKMDPTCEHENGGTDGKFSDMAKKVGHAIGYDSNPFRVEVEWTAFGKMKRCKETLNQEDYDSIFDLAEKSKFGKAIMKKGPLVIHGLTVTSKKPGTSYVVNQGFLRNIDRVSGAMGTRNLSLVKTWKIDLKMTTDDGGKASNEFKDAVDNIARAFRVVFVTIPTQSKGSEVKFDNNYLSKSASRSTFDALFGRTVPDIRVDGKRVFAVYTDVDGSANGCRVYSAGAFHKPVSDPKEGANGAREFAIASDYSVVVPAEAIVVGNDLFNSIRIDVMGEPVTLSPPNRIDALSAGRNCANVACPHAKDGKATCKAPDETSQCVLI